MNNEDFNFYILQTVPPNHTAGLYKASISVYWGNTYMLEDAHGLYGMIRHFVDDTITKIQ